MATTTSTIGFVGLGHMGGSMAARLLAAGYPVHGMNRTRRRADELIAQGLQWHDTPREVAEDWIFHAYGDRASESAVAFTGVKYRSWPPRAGVTSYARIVTNRVLAEQSADLCRTIGFQGIVDLVTMKSGDKAWDDAALAAVKNGAPFSPLPAKYKGEALQVHWHFAVMP